MERPPGGGFSISDGGKAPQSSYGYTRIASIPYDAS